MGFFPDAQTRFLTTVYIILLSETELYLCIMYKFMYGSTFSYDIILTAVLSDKASITYILS